MKTIMVKRIHVYIKVIALTVWMFMNNDIETLYVQIVIWKKEYGKIVSLVKISEIYSLKNLGGFKKLTMIDWIRYFVLNVEVWGKL